MTTPPIAVQLYSLREEIKEDLSGVLKRVADIGYVGVESFGGAEPRATAQLCRDLGLTITSAHLPMPLGDDLAKTVDAAKTLGIDTIVVPWLPPERFQTIEAVQRVADDLNAAAKAVQEHGFTLAYHNHDFEFTMIDGHSAYDVLLEKLEPTIMLEVDVYWVQVAGARVADVLKNLGARAPLLHMKDGPGVTGEPMVALGQGVMDLPSVVQASAANAAWMIVELDACATDMFTAVEQSYAYLTQNGFARGNR